MSSLRRTLIIFLLSLLTVVNIIPASASAAIAPTSGSSGGGTASGSWTSKTSISFENVTYDFTQSSQVGNATQNSYVSSQYKNVNTKTPSSSTCTGVAARLGSPVACGNGSTTSNGGCFPTIYVSTSDYSKGTFQSTCTSSETIQLSNWQAYYGTNSTASGANSPTCEVGALDWAFCAVYDTLSGISDFILTKIVLPELKVTPICVSSVGTGCMQHDPTFAIWSNFRIYGDIFLVLALLVVVISEAAGGGLIDAYSVRKILPKLLAAGILINLSIYIVAALVDIFNVMGGTLGAVITAPLKGAGAFHIHADGTITLGAFAAIGSLLALTHFATLFGTHQGGAFLIDVVLVPAVMVFLAILATIVLRKTAIMGLIIISPIAFALYALPNTSKLFKKWWDILIEMLVVYPIIVIFFALSSIMAVMVNSPPSNAGVGSFGDAINSLLVLAFMVLPLVLIPFSFKMAGSTIGRLYGALEGARQKGMKMHEGRRKKTREQFAIKRQGVRAGMYNKFDQTRLGKGLSNAPVIGRSYQARQAGVTQASQLAMHQVAQMPGAKTIEHEDDALKALTFGQNQYEAEQNYAKWLEEHGGDGYGPMDKAEAQKRAKEAAAHAQAAIGFGQPQSLWAARQLAATGTGYDNLDDVSSTISRVSNGNESLKSALSGDINAVTKQASRHDLAPGYAKLKELATLQDAAKNDPTNAAKQIALREKTEQYAVDAWNSGNLYQHFNDKGQDIKNASAYFKRALYSGNPDKEDEALIFAQELEAGKGSGTGEAADLASKFLEEHKAKIAEIKNKVDTPPVHTGGTGGQIPQPGAYTFAGQVPGGMAAAPGVVTERRRKIQQRSRNLTPEDLRMARMAAATGAGGQPGTTPGGGGAGGNPGGTP